MSLKLKNKVIPLGVAKENLSWKIDTYKQKILSLLENPKLNHYKKEILSILEMKNLSDDEKLELSLWKMFWISRNKLLEMIKQDRIDKAFQESINFLKVDSMLTWLQKMWILPLNNKKNPVTI